jgi:hypothetical protein
MPDPKYVITNGANSSSVGATINGCKIKVTGANPPHDYEFYTQNGSTYAQKVTGPLPVTFKDISITQGNITTTWDITVDTLPSLTDAGSWTTPSAFSTKPEDTGTGTSGEFTAQTGGAIDPEEAAASAGYGKN